MSSVALSRRLQPYVRPSAGPHRKSRPPHEYEMPLSVALARIRSSLSKRGVIGTYHNVSKEYLLLYLSEFSFRFNNRKNPDIFDEILRGC